MGKNNDKTRIGNKNTKEPGGMSVVTDYDYLRRTVKNTDVKSFNNEIVRQMEILFFLDSVKQHLFRLPD